MKKILTPLAAFLLIAWVIPSSAAEKSEMLGIGGFFNLHQPISSFGDWYSKTAQYGGRLMVASSRVAIEAEYHRSIMDPGSIEKRAFIWSVDNKPYISPNARSRMVLNVVTVNGLLFLRTRSANPHAGDYIPYVTVGAGQYRYVSEISGLIWPGQKTPPLSPSLELAPFEDRKNSFGFFLGAGVEAFIMGHVSLDLRARYNVAFGKLSPLEAWGLKETSSLQMIDVGVGIKFYLVHLQ